MSTKLSDFPITTVPTGDDHFLTGVSNDGGIFANFRVSVANVLKRIQAATASQLGGVTIGSTSGLEVSEAGALSAKLKATSGLTKDGNGISLIYNAPLLTKGYREAFISFTQTGTSAPVGAIAFNDNGVPIDDQFTFPAWFTREGLGVYRMYFDSAVTTSKVFIFPEKTVFNDGELFQMEISMTTTYIQFNFSSYEPVSDPPFAAAEYDGFPAFKFKVVFLP